MTEAALAASVAGLECGAFGRVPYSERSRASRSLGPEHPDSFSLRERKVAPGYGYRHKKWHNATMPEPARAKSLRNTNYLSGVLARNPGRDLFPKLPLDLTPHRQRAGERHCSSIYQLLHPPCSSSHKHSMIKVLQPVESAICVASNELTRPWQCAIVIQDSPCPCLFLWAHSTS